MYLSGQRSDSDAGKGLKGAGGDVVHVFDVNPRRGAASEADPIELPDATRDGAAVRDELHATEERWLELEEKRTHLSGAR